MSETWTPNNDNSGNKPETLEGYQNYHGVKGKSLKSGCRFYVREDINFKVALVVKLKLVFTD